VAGAPSPVPAFAALIRPVADFPAPGILFRDIAPLLADADGFAAAIAALAAPWRNAGLDAVAGIEARGFIFGAGVAIALGVGFIPVRKKGKLPGETIGQNYALEYGVDTIEIHADVLEAGDRVLMVDDLIATGGTALAAVSLLRRTGAAVEHAGFVIDLFDLGGADKLRDAGVRVEALIPFEGH
jgi:adenine phosphoribosyltransferase